MAYGTTKVDTIQSSTANTPVQFQDGNGTQIGTLCRAWVNFNGTGTVAIRASFNVSSITDNGTGNYTINFTNAMPDANYSVSGGICTNIGGGCVLGWQSGNLYSTTQFQFFTAQNDSSAANDPSVVNVAVFR